MNITNVQVTILDPDNSIKALADITIDHEFVIHGLAIRKHHEGGYFFVTYPFRIKNDKRKDIAHPINDDCRRYIEDTVLDAYEIAINQKEHP